MFKVGDLVKVSEEVLKASSFHNKDSPVCIVIRYEEPRASSAFYTLYNIYTRKTYRFRSIDLDCYYVHVTKGEF